MYSIDDTALQNHISPGIETDLACGFYHHLTGPDHGIALTATATVLRVLGFSDVHICLMAD